MRLYVTENRQGISRVHASHESQGQILWKKEKSLPEHALLFPSRNVVAFTCEAPPGR